MNAKDEIEILTKIKHIEVELSELKASLSLPLNSMSLKEFYKNTVIELNGCKYFNNQAVIDKYCKLYADEVMKEEQSKLKRWEPYKTGYYIDTNGNIYWMDDIDYDYPAPHNCFRTKQLAKLRAKQRQAEDELFNIWEHLVGDWRPDWDDKKAKYYVFYFTKDKREQIYAASDLIILPIYRYFPNDKMAIKQYELASDHAKAYMRGEF
jgi:hypothetical protein